MVILSFVERNLRYMWNICRFLINIFDDEVIWSSLFSKNISGII